MLINENCAFDFIVRRRNEIIKSLVSFSILMSVSSSELALHLTVSGLAKVAIFTTNVDAENQTWINHKCVCGALNRHFCQTRVMRSAFFSVVHFRHYKFFKKSSSDKISSVEPFSISLTAFSCLLLIPSSPTTR
jgi:hypothetical protein